MCKKNHVVANFVLKGGSFIACSVGAQCLCFTVYNKSDNGTLQSGHMFLRLQWIFGKQGEGIRWNSQEPESHPQ